MTGSTPLSLIHISLVHAVDFQGQAVGQPIAAAFLFNKGLADEVLQSSEQVCIDFGFNFLAA